MKPAAIVPLPLLRRASVLRAAALLLLAPCAAQALRDPMEPPAQAPRLREPAAVVVAAAAPAVDPVVRTIVTVDGQRWVVVGARRHGVGERIGGWRIECIHAGGVVARDEGGARRQLPLFGAVTVRPAAGSAPSTGTAPAADPAACPDPESKSSKRKSP